MLRVASMSKLTIAGPRTYIERVIRELHRLKVLHIIEHVKEGDVDIGKPLKNADTLSAILVRIRSLSSYLNIDKRAEVREFKLKRGYYDLDKTSRNLIADVNERLNELKSIESSIERNTDLIKRIEELKPLGLPLDSFGFYKSIVCFVGYLEDVEGFEKNLVKITSKFEIYKADRKKKLMAIFVEEGKSSEVLELLRNFDFAEFDLSGVRGLKGDVEKNLSRLEVENSKLARKKEILNKSLQKLKDEWEDYLLFGEEFLAKEMEKAEAPLKFATTKNAFVIKGWVPTKNLEEVVERLNKITRKKIFIQTEDVAKEDKVPVKLKNPKVVKPFEFFMELYALPTYKEIDPTFFVFLIFPLLFGFMLGDIGYGIITLVVALSLRKRIQQMRGFFDVFIFSSISTIFFGMLFGEIFGEEVLFGIELPHILSRAHSADILLTVSIVFGIMHLLGGLILGFVNVYNEHGLKHAIYEKGGWILLFPALAKLILALNLIKGWFAKAIEFVLPPNYIVIGLAAIGVILIFLGEGIKGVIELPGIFSNILSYARLMAIGIASVMLAIVVNDMAKELFHGGIFMILMGILILIIGHTINIALGWLGCFLQSLRLHYVEFFTKFFKGGAQPYKPFGVRE
jgi:V/A-type H+-transporting ATPase subunit I